jgi:hypothetical protein
MAGRQYPWVLAEVCWAQGTVYTRGTYEGLPLLSWGIAPRKVLATYRQLRAAGLRPGGADPVAVLYFHSRRGMRMVFANLYLIAAAKPLRPMTPAKWAAIRAADAAQRTCPTCPPGQRVKPYRLTAVGQCWDCYAAAHPDDDTDVTSPVADDWPLAA